jgi:hypothetical protein
MRRNGENRYTERHAKVRPGDLLMDLPAMDDREMECALRLLLTEWCTRHGLSRTDMHEGIDDLFDMASASMFPVELFEHPSSHEVLPRLSEPGCAYAVLTGRNYVSYRARSAREYDLLVRSTFSPLPPRDPED